MNENKIHSVQLVCPKCRMLLAGGDDNLLCQNCQREYPVVNNVPVMINEDNSLFSISEYIKHNRTTRVNEKAKESAMKKVLRSFILGCIPEITLNLRAKKNFAHLTKLLKDRQGQSLVLVIGGGDLGFGMEEIAQDPAVKLITGDVYFGKENDLIFDAHDLPFADKTFDAVIIQAVLEHVIDPARCVAEITRVLKKNGMVYAEIPFMQQGHEGRYDFTRFTLTGIRRLFNYFQEIDSGCVCGPGVVVAWSISRFFDSFSRGKAMFIFRNYILPYFIFWIKYLDYYFVKKSYVADNASGLFFLGILKEIPLSDKEIVSKYCG